MRKWEVISDRTKRRRIAAEISKMVSETQVMANTIDSATLSQISNTPDSMGDPSHSNKESADLLHLGARLTSLNKRDLDITVLCSRSDVGSEHACGAPYSPDTSDPNIARLGSNSDVVNEHVCSAPDSDCYDLDEVNILTFESDSSQSDETAFLESIHWTARAVEDDDDDSKDLASNEATLHDKLANWAVAFNISHGALSDLLGILQPLNPDLPKDARTLLRTCREVQTVSVAGGDYYYFGVKFWLQMLLQKSQAVIFVEQLTLHINIDGIPLFKSSTMCLWPILGSFKEIEGSPFPVAVYCSTHKPNSLDDYVKDFIVEMKELEMVGFTSDVSQKTFKIKLGAIICDAPARAFVKCIKTHNGYDCCERCVQRGQWLSKIILPNLSAQLRTDESFASREDASHHVGISPFTQLACGMVSHFPLDYMHLICLGAVRRLLHLWIHGSRSQKLSQNTLTAVSERLSLILPFIPREFSRKPRSLCDYKIWKATELRLFLVYTGPVVLKGLLSPDAYSNFLDLSIAVRILLSPGHLEFYLDFADQLLKYFVQTFCNLYGKDQLVYNIHSLIHLADDARKFGVLDNISSFKYESYLGQLKKLVRSPHLPCAQLVRRVLETSVCHLDKSGKCNIDDKDRFCKPHLEGPVTV